MSVFRTVIAAAALATSACGADDAISVAEIVDAIERGRDADREPEPQPPVMGAAPDPLAVQDILDARCAFCHSASAAAGGLATTDIDELIALGQIVPGDAESSLLVARMRDGTMPPAASLDRRDIELIADFVDGLE